VGGLLIAEIIRDICVMVSKDITFVLGLNVTRENIVFETQTNEIHFSSMSSKACQGRDIITTLLQPKTKGRDYEPLTVSGA